METERIFALIALGLAILAGLAAYQVRRRSRLDAAILATLAAFLVLRFLATTHAFNGGLFFLFGLPYSLGILLLVCFFFTPIRGWQRLVYLGVSLYYLSSLFALFLAAFAFLLGTHR